MGLTNAQLTKNNKQLTEDLAKMLIRAEAAEGKLALIPEDAAEATTKLAQISGELDTTKEKLMTANRELATMKQRAETAESNVTKESLSDEELDEIEEKELVIEAEKAGARVRRKPVLEQRTANRAGRLPEQLKGRELAIEEKCNEKLRKLNMVINGEQESLDILG